MKKVTFGRSQDNDIIIDDKSVSRHHGYLLVDGSKVYVVDDNSLNGIYVNGKRITDKLLLSYRDNVLVAKLFKLDWQRYTNDDVDRTVRNNVTARTSSSAYESHDQSRSNRQVLNDTPRKKNEAAYQAEEKKSDWKKSFLSSAGKIFKYIISTVVTLVVMALINKWLRG